MEKEEAALGVVVVRRDAKHAQSLPLPEQLLLPGVHPMVRGGLRYAGESRRGRKTAKERDRKTGAGRGRKRGEKERGG